MGRGARCPASDPGAAQERARTPAGLVFQRLGIGEWVSYSSRAEFERIVRAWLVRQLLDGQDRFGLVLSEVEALIALGARLAREAEAQHASPTDPDRSAGGAGVILRRIPGSEAGERCLLVCLICDIIAQESYRALCGPQNDRSRCAEPELSVPKLVQGFQSKRWTSGRNLRRKHLSWPMTHPSTDLRITTLWGVRLTVERTLDQLPPSYTTDVWQATCDTVYQHIYDKYYGAGRSVYALAA
ncbi:MAG: hypothetical protein R2844_00775 [Caldilineales bacterium]